MSESSGRGKPVRGAVGGLVTGWGIGMLLFLFGVVESDSVVILLMPILFAGVGIGLGISGPLKRSGGDAEPSPEPG